MLPDKWQKRKIGKMGEVFGGRQRSPHYTEGAMTPYLRVANVFDGYIDASDVLEMAFSEKEFSKYRLQLGDLLLNEGQSLELVGRCAIYRGDPPDCCFQNTLICFRPDGTVDSEFAQCLFQWLQYRGVFAKAASRTTSIAHLGVSRFASLETMWPPIEEQGAIASIMSAWNRAIEQTTRLVELHRQLCQGLMQQLLTGKRRFGEFIMSKGTRRADFISLPSDWDYPKIGDIASEVNERNSSSGVVPVLSCTKYDGLVDSMSYFGKRVFSEDTSGYKIVRYGQFAYATNHIEEGSIGLLESLGAGLVSPMYTVFQTADRVYAPFLYRVFKSDLYTQIFSANTNATVDRRGSLRWNQFKTIRVPLPSLPEQKKIAAVLDTVDKEVALLGAQLEALKLQKKSLMQKLLTGQKRVRV